VLVGTLVQVIASHEEVVNIPDLFLVVTENGLAVHVQHTAELHETLRIKRCGDVKLVAVAGKIVELIHIHARALVGHYIEEEGFAWVSPDPLPSLRRIGCTSEDQLFDEVNVAFFKPPNFSELAVEAVLLQ
jgi:hypothetical protein